MDLKFFSSLFSTRAKLSKLEYSTVDSIYFFFLQYSMKIKYDYSQIINLIKNYLQITGCMAHKNIRYSYSFLDKFAIDAKIPNSNDIILRSRDSDEQILMKQIQVTPGQYEETLATLQYQKKLSHEQLLSLVDYHSQPTAHKFIVLYQYCNISLEDQFQNRLAEGRCFQQSQLWSIFTSLAFGLAYLQQENVGHGSVSLNDCYLNEQGFIKISDPTCASSNPYTVVNGYYYAPQILRCLIKETGQEINIFKSDVFALGCCMLQLTLMRQISELFDYERGFVNRQVLRCLLSDIGSLDLSREYVEFIKQILHYDYQQRPDFLTLKVKIFNLLSMEPTQQSEELMRQSYEIKSSISSMCRSKGQHHFKQNNKEMSLSKQAHTLKNQIQQEAKLGKVRQPLGQIQNGSNCYMKPIKLQNMGFKIQQPNVDHLFGNMKKSIQLKSVENISVDSIESIPIFRQQRKGIKDEQAFTIHQDILQIQQNIQKMQFKLNKKRRVRGDKNKDSKLLYVFDAQSSFQTDYSKNSRHTGDSALEQKYQFKVKPLEQSNINHNNSKGISSRLMDDSTLSQNSMFNRSDFALNSFRKREKEQYILNIEQPIKKKQNKQNIQNKQNSCAFRFKQPQLFSNKYQFVPTYEKQNKKQQIYTDPNFLKMMKADVQQIMHKRNILY